MYQMILLLVHYNLTDDDMKVVESLMEAVYDVGAGDNVTIVVGTI